MCYITYICGTDTLIQSSRNMVLTDEIHVLCNRLY